MRTSPQLAIALLLASVGAQAQTCKDNILATAPDSRYRNNGDETVTDLSTGLIWKQCAEGLSGADCLTGNPSTFTWQQALQHAEAQVFAGSSLWRLPNKNELASLVERRCFDPAINGRFFPNTPSDGFWSSSPDIEGSFNGYGPVSAWYVEFLDGRMYQNFKSIPFSVRLVRGGQSVPLDDHGNGRGTATPIAVDSRTAGRIDYPGDNDYFRLQVGIPGVLTLYTTGTTDTYGYLLNAQGKELAHNDDASATNANFRIARSMTPGTYYVRIRHFSTGGTGAYSLVSDFRAATGKPQRAVLLLHGMNSDPGTWNELVDQRWSARCAEIYDGVAMPKVWAQDDLGAICYRLRFGRYDATGSTGLEDLRCNNGSNPVGCKGDFTALFDPVGNDLGVEVFLAVRAILARLGSDTQVVLLGHSRGGLAARAFLQRPMSSPERKAVVGLVATGTPHRGSPLGRIYTYLATYCLDGKGQRINSSNRAGQVKAIWSACEDDWEAVDDLNFNFIMDAKLYLGKPTIKFLAPDSSQIQALNAKNALANLPAGLSVVQWRYAGQYLGHLATGYSAWNHPGGQLFNQFSLRSRDYALCGKVTLPGSCPYDELTPAFNGDGIVPRDWQGIPGLQAVPGLAANVLLTMTRLQPFGVFHKNETKRSADIDKALGFVQAWK